MEGPKRLRRVDHRGDDARQGGSDATVALMSGGGKDSTLAFHRLCLAGRRPGVVVATVTDRFDRVTMHGVRRGLFRSHVKALVPS